MLDELQLIFTSTTGRSGTKYLANIVNNNALNATAEHDPYPRGYDTPIRWYDNREDKKLLKLAKRKIKRLNRKSKILRTFAYPDQNKILPENRFSNRLKNFIPKVELKEIYLESTHAFIKSFGESMYDLTPDLYIIHLTRSPFEVAKSFFNRRSIPGPNNPYLLDPNFKRNKIKLSINMTDYQKCLWYWFETEVRHKDFLEKHDVEKVIEIDVDDLNDEKKVKKMLKELGITYKKEIYLDVGRNKNKKATMITSKDIKEAKELIEVIPNWVFDKINSKYDIISRV